MGYYQGDFYGSRRRFGRGDPGFFSFLGGLAKSAVGFIPGVGPIASKVLGAIGSPARTGAVSKAVEAGRGAVTAGTAIIKKHPVLSAAGAAGGIGAVGLGHHLLAHPAVQRAIGGHRRKRMNVCNPRALRRAIRRTHGFAKLAMKTIHLVHPKKKARFGGFRKKKSKR